jgi:hypothetical protein
VLDSENTVSRVHTAEAQQILLHWDAFGGDDKCLIVDGMEQDFLLMA